MRIIFFFLVLLLAACSAAKADDSIVTMDCKNVVLSSGGSPLQRCESNEAICFVTDQGGISCLKK